MRRTLLILATVLGIGVLGLALSAPYETTRELAAAPAAQTAASIEANTAVQRSATTTYSVVKVIDGDTLVVNIAGANTTLRLIGMDTPEVVDPRKPVQCFGVAASNEAKKLLSGKRVALEYDPSQGTPSSAKASKGTVDKYGRTLAYIYMEDGTLYNEYMIAAGYAHEYTYDLPYKYQTEFKAAQRSAMAAKKGLWADAACAAESSRTAAATRTTVAAPAHSPSAFTPTKQYVCDRNAYNCADFSSQAEAQYVFGLCGGDAHDIHQLDRDRDGSVCESLP